jgi:hypothetical protein
MAVEPLIIIIIVKISYDIQFALILRMTNITFALETVNTRQCMGQKYSSKSNVKTVYIYSIYTTVLSLGPIRNSK